MDLSRTENALADVTAPGGIGCDVVQRIREAVSEKSITELLEARRGGGQAGMAARGATQTQTQCRPNLKRRMDSEAGPSTGPGELHVCLGEALRAAKGNLEALLETGGAEKMKSEELEELGSCAVAVLQMVEKGKESVKKSERAALLKEKEERAAKDAAATAELERREKENAELQQLLCTQGIVIQSQHAAQNFREEQIENLTSDLRRLEEQNAKLQKDAIEQRSELTRRGKEVRELTFNIEELRVQMRGRLKVMTDLHVEMLEGKQDNVKCRICCARARNTIIFPCYHFEFCNSCLQRHRQRASTCPTCKIPISRTMDFYAS